MGHVPLKNPSTQVILTIRDTELLDKRGMLLYVFKAAAVLKIIGGEVDDAPEFGEEAAVPLF